MAFTGSRQGGLNIYDETGRTFAQPKSLWVPRVLWKVWRAKRAWTSWIFQSNESNHYCRTGPHIEEKLLWMKWELSRAGKIEKKEGRKVQYGEKYRVRTSWKSKWYIIRRKKHVYNYIYIYIYFQMWILLLVSWCTANVIHYYHSQYLLFFSL